MDFRKWEVVNRMQQGRQETVGRSSGEEAAGSCFSRFLLQCLLSFICITSRLGAIVIHLPRIHVAGTRKAVVSGGQL
jgi:hypothetical protein